jgi:hypothetical protein
MISQPIKAAFEIAVIPAIKCGAWDAQHIKRLLGGKMREYPKLCV